MRDICLAYSLNKITKSRKKLSIRRLIKISIRIKISIKTFEIDLNFFAIETNSMRKEIDEARNRRRRRRRKLRSSKGKLI